MSGILKVQKALYDRLTNYSPLTDKVEGVFDYVKENQKMPYVVLGEIISIPYFTKTTTGEEVVQTIYIFSSGKGKKEIEEIISEIKSALNEDLNIENHESYYQRLDSIEIFNEGTYIQGVLKVRVKIMEV
ncbi:tail completion protein gp17 [Paramaledivibacter caminithermalis]|jgi:hypothetical protein|uniref:Phage protein n=1 Tax=Paramaledivibacter caminithermalis (strain DSM 15212 / CIP 107654 / DViRD3) TaxID=1121301 RepID=A0A1M6SW54_PARC5|nr:DUF3168 domain-containing protein [Paramaledivibacter caminithermalis]SHK48951.1 Protein of unknown function [Paramaledivibacter caminithermalis DSM 15212]